MINGSIEHLVGMDLLRRDVKGRVLAVRVGRDTFVDVVLADGTFESWYLPLCAEVEPGALLRKIEASVEAAAETRRTPRESPVSTSNGKSIAAIVGALLCPGEPPPVEEPAIAVDDGKETLVWIQGSPSTSEDTWHLGHEGGNWLGAPYSSWDWFQAASYAGMGAVKERREAAESHRDGCKTIAAWAREDGYAVPPHPVYGEV